MYYNREPGVMAIALRISILKLILGTVTTVLILAAIIMEFLPEDESKIFVIPTLAAALFITISQIGLYKKYWLTGLGFRYIVHYSQAGSWEIWTNVYNANKMWYSNSTRCLKHNPIPVDATAASNRLVSPSYADYPPLFLMTTSSRIVTIQLPHLTTHIRFIPIRTYANF